MIEAEIDGFYGGSHTECTVFVYTSGMGTWYAVEGGTMANFTYDDEILTDGVDIELLSDVDCFTVNKAIDSLERLVELVDE